MANLTSVGVTSGVPTSGTGTVSTIDALMALLPAALGGGGGLKVDGSGTVLPVSVPTDPFGANADAASATGSISAKLRALATAIGTAVLTRGSGATDSGTLRVSVGSDQLGTLGQTTMSASVPSAWASDQTVAVKAVTTANGETASRVNAANSTNATNLKASAGNIFEIDVYNVAAYAVFLKLYNKASSPTVGTDTPVWTIPIAAGSGFSRIFPMGRNFGTGISYAITKLQADSDTTVVAAGDLTGSIGWI